MTIYRRRLASSFSALRQTLQRHLDAMAAGRPGPLMGLLEDAPDDDTTDDILEGIVKVNRLEPGRKAS